MAVATLKFIYIKVFFIAVLTNPFVCLCICPRHESEALLNITFPENYFSIGIPWTNETDCCEWDSVHCDKNKSHVLRISLNAYPDNYGIRGGVISDSLCKLAFLTEIHIWNIGTTGTLPSCLGNLHYLNAIYMQDNALSGVIPLSICMLTNLTDISLYGNQLNGSLPSCLNNLSSLKHLDVYNNRLSGRIPFTWGNLALLRSLDVSFNQLVGNFPLSFAGLSSLTELYARGNRFNESTPYWALPSSIESLSLSLNDELTVSETFFHNLANLRYFYLSNCTLNISTSWIPNFQLRSLELVSCQIDSRIPTWISTQFMLNILTLANNGLAGEIPSWLWEMASSLIELNLTQNHLHGPLLPNGPGSRMIYFDVSRNAFSGYIPSVWSSNIAVLMLNDNLFIGNIPPSLCNLSELVMLNLENNKLDGIIPWCLIHEGVQVLNLGGNSLEGRIPEGLSISSSLESLVIKNNQLSGTFLPSFIEDSALQVLDIGHNKFIGHLPKSIGNISSLKVLVMKDNQFSGNILPEIGNLKQLQILDLSSNNLSGTIPHDIVFLQAMAVAREDGYVLHLDMPPRTYPTITDSSLGGLNMSSKGIQLYYPYILSTLTAIYLSNNQLNGDVPLDIGKLKGLRFLNLSMNNLSGIIPRSLGDMSQLESLDLSSNKLSGNIPSELQSLSYLGYLNLSNNNLCGSIPQGGQMITFENTSYSGNPNLHGCPLPKNCSWPKFRSPPPLVSDSEDKDEESEQIPWYEIGLGLSYGAGILCVVVLLISVRESWRKKYFKGIDNILKFVFHYLPQK